MKRRGSKIHDQPSVKKSDVNTSTDLRSKISSKLNTLLNGIQDSSIFIRSRRELYADLFREPKYPEIVIDPTIVVKLEDNETEQDQDAISQLPSENFISSAKSRLTELLNKRPDSEKENSVSVDEPIPVSSIKSKTLQSNASSLKSRTKKSTNLESCSASHSDILISQGQLQNASIGEDVMKTRSGTKVSHLCPSGSQKSQTSTSSQKPCPRNKKSMHRKCNAKDKQTVINENTTSETCDNVCLDISDSHPSASSTSDLQSYFLRNNVLNSLETSKHSNCDIVPEVLLTELDSNDVNQHLYETGYGSEEINSPEVYFSVGESTEPDLAVVDKEIIPESNSHDPDIVLVCVKRPTYEVITLEEDDDSAEIIEEVHQCSECGKTFRAKSLLNFHLRMHASHSSVPQIPSNSRPSSSTRSSLRKS